MLGSRPTYFLTCITHGRRSLFQSNETAKIVYDSILHYAAQGKFHLHAFVVMPNHIHVLFEPTEGIAVQKCVQFIKGGASHRLRERFNRTIWQDGYHDHRVRDDAEFVAYLGYIERNPAKRGLREWPWVWFASGAKAPLISQL